MNDLVLIAKCITLLFRESILDIKEINSADAVRTALDFVKLPDSVLEVNSNGVVLSNLKKMALTMCDMAGTTTYDPAELIQDLRIACMTDEVTFSALKDSIEAIVDTKGLKISVGAVSKQIQNFFREKKAEEILAKAYTQLKFKRKEIKDMRPFLAALCSELEPFTDVAATNDPAIIAAYDLTDDQSIVKAFNKVDDINSGKALMKTGLQGINDMYGGGFRRGMTGVVYGLGHHGKSLIAMEWFRDFCMLNEPYMNDITKKPCNVFITFENEAENNIDMWYKLIREAETLQSIDDLPPMNADERSQYIKAKFSQTGYHAKIYRIQEGGWGYRDLCNYVLWLESQGYEVHAIVIDYLMLANKVGCATGATGVDIQDLFKKVRSFMSVRDTLCISPHQLNSEVKTLARDTDEAEIVRKLPGAGYSYLCKTLENELDFELFIYLVKKKGKYYYTFQRGKHRVNNPAPIELHYTVYESHTIGRLRSDLNGPSMALKRPGEKPAHMAQPDHDAEFFGIQPKKGNNVTELFSV